jgi:predicted RNA binding protein YcfA (HicA-like mRNA interferase family)
MSKMPAIGGKDLVRALHFLGFNEVRIRGSHHFLEHSDGRATVIPVHGNETIGPGLLSRIMRESEITREQLLSVL